MRDPITYVIIAVARTSVWWFVACQVGCICLYLSICLCISENLCIVPIYVHIWQCQCVRACVCANCACVCANCACHVCTFIVYICFCIKTYTGCLISTNWTANIFLKYLHAMTNINEVTTHAVWVRMSLFTLIGSGRPAVGVVICTAVFNHKGWTGISIFDQVKLV